MSQLDHPIQHTRFGFHERYEMLNCKDYNSQYVWIFFCNGILLHKVITVGLNRDNVMLTLTVLNF